MPKKIKIFLFIDALGWDIVTHYNFLSEKLPERRPVKMQFGYSCSAIPTILTGLSPAEHGHLGLFQFAPEKSPFSGLINLDKILRPKNFWCRGRVRYWLSKLVKRYYGFTGYFQLYQMPFEKLGQMDYVEKHDIFAAGGLAPALNLRDILDKSGLSYHISDWRRSDEYNIDAACKALKSGCNFLFIYTAGLDALRHRCGVESPEIAAMLEWYCKRVGILLDTAHHYGEVDFTVLSDHGMTPLTGTVDIKNIIDASGLRFGYDYGVCYDSTMARFYYLTREAERRIPELLKSYESAGHWLTQEEEHRYGIYRADRIFGDAIFLLNPGVQMVPSDLSLTVFNGMHGFAPEDLHSSAAILSNRAIPDYVVEVADYFTYMKRAIDILKQE